MKLIDGDFAFLEDVVLKERSVDVFPLYTELVG